MPPSPSLRYSPGKEPLGDSHKRGRSLERGLSFEKKDDDLALFNEMQSKERDNFLLQSTDDLEDIFSTSLKPFPDFKLGIAIPARGESSGLLNADDDKNDYDWLFTPPDTPLFPSLDDEPTPANLVYSGRPRSRPISISRSSTMEKSYRTYRGSASPQCSSSSPRSSTSTTFKSQGRPSSAPRSSPSPSLRRSTPTRRPSPPPVNPYTPPPRSATRTPRRSSTGSGAAFSSGIRGASPVRSSRRSSSPKVRAWQSNIPGFSLEAPPNLRTSLADRPASYVRGSSPASRNSIDSSSKFRRQSMSPTATRSISSSHSHERDRFSSQSKGSVASSIDDDADSLLSAPMNGSEHCVSKRGVGGLSNNRSTTSVKKPTKTFSPGSAPRRSFDAAIRQMDRRSPQNMFRPLLSGVPSTTFYGRKTSSSHRSVISINSSVTTSSNASSDQLTSGAPDTEGSEHNQDDVVSECGRIPYVDGNDEIFTFDKMDAVGEDTGLEIHDQSPVVQLGKYHKTSAFESKPNETDELHCHNAAGLSSASSEALYAQGDYVDGDTLLCSRCDRSYSVTELVEGDVNICPECKQKKGIVVNSISSSIVDAPLDSSALSANISKEIGPSNAFEVYLAALEPLEVMEIGESATDFQNVSAEDNEKQSKTSYQELSKDPLDNPHAVSEGKTSTPMLSDAHLSGEHITTIDLSNNGSYELHKSNDDPLTKIDVGEGAGILVLLSKRSNSSKGPAIQRKSFTATAVSYDVQSYARESTTSMRSSIVYGSASTSSSIDMGSRHAELPMQRQLSGRKSGNSSKPESIGSSFSQSSSCMSQGLGLTMITNEDNINAYVGSGGHLAKVGPETPPHPTITSENNEPIDREASFSRLTFLERDDFHSDSVANDSRALELPTDVTQLEDSSFLPLVVDEHNLHAIDNHLSEEVENNRDMEDSAAILGSVLVDDSAMLDGGIDQMEISEASNGNLARMPEIEICHLGSPGSQNDVVTGDASQETSNLSVEAEDTSVTASLSNDPEVVHGIADESTVMVEDQDGRHVISLTLEEATDTILFCSSIIHDLAYEAASIAIEKEKENPVPLEVTRPIRAVVGKPSSDRGPLGRSTRKRTSKAKKVKRRRGEMETNLPSSNAQTADDKPGESTIQNVSLPHKVDSMKPPKLDSKCNCTIM